MPDDVLDRRALGRATLARQLLLARDERPVPEAIEHLVGLQAQVPRDPYLALWSRLEKFDPDALGQLLVDRDVVRIVLMRGTIHLVTARDSLRLRRLFQPVLDAELVRHSEFGPHLRDVDLAPVLAYARELFSERPRTGPQLRAALGERFPDLHAPALAYACRNHLALVQVPPRGVWGERGAVTTTTTAAWLGHDPDPAASVDDMVLRYLGAFGPATVADVAAWSRLTGLREVVDRLEPQLRRFRDEDGRELVDLPDAPRPDPGTQAPPRFLPEYDNALLSHADRRRFVPEEHRSGLAVREHAIHGTVLADGVVVATWRIEEADDRRATLFVDQAVRLTKRAGSAVTAEGRRLLRLVAADAPGHDVRLVPPA